MKWLFLLNESRSSKKNLYFKTYFSFKCSIFFFSKHKPPLINLPFFVFPGGNSGIGKVTAIELAQRGARVIIGCRNKVKAEAAVTLIRQRTGSDAVHYIPLDLASFQSVQEFVDMFMKQFSSAYALINNAGIVCLSVCYSISLSICVCMRVCLCLPCTIIY